VRKFERETPRVSAATSRVIRSSAAIASAASFAIVSGPQAKNCGFWLAIERFLSSVSLDLNLEHRAAELPLKHTYAVIHLPQSAFSGPVVTIGQGSFIQHRPPPRIRAGLGATPFLRAAGRILVPSSGVSSTIRILSPAGQ
jgi:hypothetical protein